MKNKLTVSIPNACHEKWQNFTQTSTDKMCGTCNTAVIDFTAMSDADIIKFFSQAQTHTCGRFRPDQLRSYTIIPPVKVNIGYTLLKAGVFSMLLALVSKPSAATAFTEKEKVVASYQSDATTVVERLSEDDKSHTVEGIVKSQGDNEPLPGVYIYLKGTTDNTSTDIDGRFEFPKKLNPGDVLVFSFIGFTTQEYVVAEQQAQTIDVQMELYLDIQILGAVMVEVPEQSSSYLNTIWQKVKGWF